MLLSVVKAPRDIDSDLAGWEVLPGVSNFQWDKHVSCDQMVHGVSKVGEITYIRHILHGQARELSNGIFADRVSTFF